MDEMSSQAEKPKMDVEGVDGRATRQSEGRSGEPGQISIVSSRSESCIQLFQTPWARKPGYPARRLQGVHVHGREPFRDSLPTPRS